MRTCEARFGFLSTYSSTVFVKREADSSFLLSSPIWCGTTQPSLRELLAGFCLMAVSEPKYIESQTFQARNVSIDLGNILGYEKAANILRSCEALLLSESPVVNMILQPITPNRLRTKKRLSHPTVWFSTLAELPLRSLTAFGCYQNQQLKTRRPG